MFIQSLRERSVQSPMFREKSMAAREFDINNFCSEFNFEAAAVIQERIKLIIFCFYSSLGSHTNEFYLQFFRLFKLKTLVGVSFNAEFDTTTYKSRVSDLKYLLRRVIVTAQVIAQWGNSCLDKVLLKICVRGLQNVTIRYFFIQIMMGCLSTYNVIGL